MFIFLAETSSTMFEECNMEQPYKPHPMDCRLFYQCAPGPNGNEYVEKSCGENMFYNPQIQVCDWPASVIQIRPECLSEQTSTKTEWTKFTTLGKNIITTSMIIFVIFCF